jgi:hypothetical protein
MHKALKVYWILFIAAGCFEGVLRELILKDKPDVRRLIEA